MRSIHRTIALGAVAGIVAVSIGLGAAAPADAANLNWLNGTKPGQFILNVLGSVLGGAKVGTTAGDLKQSVISQDQLWDHSWEGLEQQWKTSATAVPQTYQDYVLQEQQYFAQNGISSKQGDLTTAGNAKKYVNTGVKMPATKPAQWVKNVAGAVGTLAVVTAWDHRAEIGAGVASVVGVDDTTGAVCANSATLTAGGAGGVAAFQNWVTGANCDAWQAAQNYTPNIDLSQRPAGWQSYPMCLDYQATSCTRLFTGNDLGITNPGSSPITVTMTAQKLLSAQGGMSLYTWCRTATNTFNVVQTSYPRNFTATGDAQTLSPPACPAPTVLYAFSFSTTGTPGTGQTTSPDTFAASMLNRMWFSSLSPKFISGVDPSNTQRTNVCSVVGDDGNTYTSTSAPYIEGKNPNPGATMPTVPDGVMTKSLHCVQTGGGSSNDIIPQTDTTPQFQAWWGQYPECRHGACSLQLVRKSDGLSCFDDSVVASATNCADWFADPAKDTNYQCTYGAHNVSLTECYVYADVFKPDKVAAGQAYADPTTGQSVSGQSSPSAAKTALAKTITDPSDFSGCLDQGWANANPVEWVLVPIQCAMQWAFAPRSTVVNTDVQQLQTGWGATTPAKVVTAVQAWKLNPTPTGCNLSVPFYNVMGNQWTNVPVIQACPGDPMGSVMPWVRGIVTVIVGIGAAFACRRIVAKWVDYS